MNNDLFFSVMICCYNSEKYLSETIDSVVNQTYTNWEIVAVNDGSTDGTEEIILDYKQKGIPITYYKQENMGYAAARNKALELANGEWIAIIDHDDLCSPNRFERQAEQIIQNPKSTLFFSDDTYFNNKQKNLGYHFAQFDPSDLDLSAVSVLNHLLYHKCFIGSSTVVFNKHSALSIGGFDTSYKCIPDFVFFLKMGELYNFSVSKESLSKWRMHPNQASEEMKDINMKELRRIYIHYFTSDLVTIRVKAMIFLRYIKFYLNSISEYYEKNFLKIMMSYNSNKTYTRKSENQYNNVE